MKNNPETEKFLKISNAAKVLEVLFEISTAVHDTQSINALYRSIHKSLEKVLNTDNFFIANHNIDKDSISFPYHADSVDCELPSEILNFSQTGSLTAKVIKEEKPLIFFSDDLVKYDRENKLLNRTPIGSPCKVWLGAPLIVKKKVIGAVVVQSYSSEDKYKKSDLDILRMVAQQIAFALEKKESNDKIIEQKQVFERIFEVSPVGIALVENRVFKQVNDEFVKIFGHMTKEDFHNRSTDMIYASEKDFLKAGEIISSQLAEKTKSSFEYELVKKDKTLFPAKIINYSTHKEPLSWTVTSILDITEVKNAYNEKMKNEKLKGVLEMAGAICHELNQPLHAILGYSELLLMDKDIDKKELNEILKTIVDQIARIKKITKKLLSITQYKTLTYAGKNKIFDIWNQDTEKE